MYLFLVHEQGPEVKVTIRFPPFHQAPILGLKELKGGYIQVKEWTREGRISGTKLHCGLLPATVVNLSIPEHSVNYHSPLQVGHQDG